MSPLKTSKTLVVGTGLAGLTAAHELLSKYNRSVILFEKTAKLGGNSIKASSGINGVGTKQQIKILKELKDLPDSFELFEKDTLKSAVDGSFVGPDSGFLKKLNTLNPYHDPIKIEKLCYNSKNAIDWLTDDLGIKLEKVSQLGGHSTPRTHRGSKLPPGFDIISTIQTSLEKFKSNDKVNLQVIFNSKVIELIKKDEKIIGLKYLAEISNDIKEIFGSVILATGGFAADYSSSDSLLKEYRPDLLELPSTNGQQSTGDGHKLIKKVGGKLVGMEEIQIHPTGFINPKNRSDKWKILAGEALRGTGGILLNNKGERFVNELETRDKVSMSIFNQFANYWGLNNRTGHNSILLIMNDAGCEEMKMNFEFYMKIGLIERISITNLAEILELNQEKLLENFRTFNDYILKNSIDPLGRSKFSTKPFDLTLGTDSLIYSGEVTPVIHFTMGGALVDENARVIDEKYKKPLDGLYAIGEVMAGIHGKNRLGGSSLLECVVFGKIAAENVNSYLNQ